MLSDAGHVWMLGSNSGMGFTAKDPERFHLPEDVRVVDLIVIAKSTFFLTSDGRLFMKTAENKETTELFPFESLGNRSPIVAIFGHRHIAAFANAEGQFALYVDDTFVHFENCATFPRHSPVTRASFGYGAHTHCIVLATGELYRLQGPWQDSSTPIAAVKMLDNIRDVSCGSGAVCALTRDGKLFTWGEKSYDDRIYYL